MSVSSVKLAGNHDVGFVGMAMSVHRKHRAGLQGIEQPLGGRIIAVVEVVVHPEARIDPGLAG